MAYTALQISFLVCCVFCLPRSARPAWGFRTSDEPVEAAALCLFGFRRVLHQEEMLSSSSGGIHRASMRRTAGMIPRRSP